MTQTPDATPQHAEPAQLARGRRYYLPVIVAAVVLAALLVFALTRGGGETTAPTGSRGASLAPVSQVQSAGPATTTAAGTPSVSPSPSPVASSSAAVNPALAECTAVDEGFIPTRYAIEAVGADARVVSLGLDSEGNIAAPPLNEPATASWWNQGPLPGSDKGKAVLSIHTYRNGGAVGNDLYAGGAPQLTPGDIIKLYGDDGQVLCYEYTDTKKVWVDEYDPNSDVMVDFEGRPQLLIIVCWDFDWDTEEWDSRAFFYGSPITP